MGTGWRGFSKLYLGNIHESRTHNDVGKTEARASKIVAPKLELRGQRNKSFL